MIIINDDDDDDEDDDEMFNSEINKNLKHVNLTFLVGSHRDTVVIDI